jgi:predicted HicB family RNase H-like nuclease
MAANQIEYRCYVANVEIDREADLLRGRVINIESHVLSACGRTVSELEASLKDTVEIYLADCAEDGESAQQPKIMAQA